ncbi:MAG: DUF2284 domain-containing protein [Bacteroidales bacterium]|nr:DUF2284 domain-containing protein [Bacteroidales bacterium]
MPLDLTYTTERFCAEMDAAAYIANFRRADYFMQFCRECGNYGRRHGCPHFDYDPLSVIAPYRKIHIIGVKIVPHDENLPLSEANTLMLPVILGLNDELLALEKSLGGMAFGFAGSCPYCGEAPCARIDGLPCRHPDKVRPSLEAFGFDISKTASDLLGLEIKWSYDGSIPEYLVLVCGVYY